MPSQCASHVLLFAFMWLPFISQNLWSWAYWFISCGVSLGVLHDTLWAPEISFREFLNALIVFQIVIPAGLYLLEIRRRLRIGIAELLSDIYHRLRHKVRNVDSIHENEKPRRFGELGKRSETYLGFKTAAQ